LFTGLMGKVLEEEDGMIWYDDPQGNSEARWVGSVAGFVWSGYDIHIRYYGPPKTLTKLFL
jgi:hypothetical protein